MLSVAVVLAWVSIVHCGGDFNVPSVDERTPRDQENYLFETVPQYCTEMCEEGWYYIPAPEGTKKGLGGCYKFMIDEGPVTMFKAMEICGAQGGNLPHLLYDTHQFDLWDQFPFDVYGPAMEADPNYHIWQGVWFPYIRQCIEEEDGFSYSKARKKLIKAQGVNDYWFSVYNPLYHMPDVHWRKSQPANDDTEWSDETCVARKEWRRQFIGNSQAKSGLDDYHCNALHWVICQKNSLIALNQRCQNPAFVSSRVHADRPPYTQDPNTVCRATEQEIFQAQCDRVKPVRFQCEK